MDRPKGNDEQKGGGRPTIKEVARLARVSIGTVDRVLHGRGRVSAESEARVRKVLRETGFRPDGFARALARGRLSSLAIVLPEPEQDSGYWSLCQAGIDRASSELAAQACALDCQRFDCRSPAGLGLALARAYQHGAEAILVAALHARPLAEFIEVIGRKGHGPLLGFFDSDIAQLPHALFSGQSAYRSGLTAGRLLRLLAPTARRFVELDLVGGGPHLSERRRGFRDFLAAQADISVECLEGREDSLPDSALGICRRILAMSKASGEDIGGLFVPNASVHLYAQGFAQLTESRRPALLGYDLVEENRRALEDGHLDAVLSQEPAEQCYRGLMRLRAILDKPQAKAGEVETLEAAISIVIKENLGG